MKTVDKIDAFFRRHPRLFLAAVLLLAAFTFILLMVRSSTGSRLVYQAF